MTRLNKKVTRHSDTTVRDGSKLRALVVTLYPGGLLGLRPAKTRREELVPLDFVYSFAVKLRVQNERALKLAARNAKRRWRRTIWQSG